MKRFSLTLAILSATLFTCILGPKDENDKPSFSFENNVATQAIAGTQYEYTLRATDSDGDPVTFALIDSFAGMTLEDSVVKWTPTRGDSSGYYRVQASDGKDAYDTGRVYVEVFDLELKSIAHSAPCLGRVLFEVASFDDKMWIIGGAVSSIRTNDVYYSSNGSTWTQVSPTPAFPKRTDHSVVVYKDKLWVLFGYDSTSKNLGDIWSSSDGTTWTQVADSSAIGKRTYQTVVAYEHSQLAANALWLIGGSYFDGRATNYVDVMNYSFDGVNWIVADPQANFGPRFDHQALVHNNELLIIGGYSSPGNLKGDIWKLGSRIDTSEQVSSSVPFTSTTPPFISYDGLLWSLKDTDAIYYSSDGAAWTQAKVKSDALYNINAALVHDNKAWLFIAGSGTIFQFQ